jgi:HlyD family secretion protein
MRRLLRIVVRVMILSALVILGLQLVLFQRAQRQAENTATQIEAETVVQTDDLKVTVSATGPLLPARQTPLAFEIAAPVKEILVREGDSVVKGDVLARLDTTDLDAALTSAQIALESQRAAFNALVARPREVDIAAAKASLTAAQASAGAASLKADASQLEIARLQTEIARNQLWQQQLQGVVLKDFPEPIRNAIAPESSPASLRNSEYNVQLADVNYEKAKNQGADVASLSAASAQIVAARAQLDRLVNGPTVVQRQIAETQLAIAQASLDQAAANLKRAVLVAPFDGVIAQNNLVVGEAPPQGQALQLIDNRTFYVDVAVDETDIAELSLGQPVSFKLDALPDAQVTGKVERIAVTPVKAGQLVTYAVRVVLDATDEPVRAGMSSTATIVVKQLQDVLILPNRFIRIDRATQKAFVVVQRPDKTFQDVEVKLGLRNETDSQILSGLEAGQRVVLLPRASFNPIPGG